MSLVDVHLEQISYSCQGINSLPFPPAKIFTNALLSNHDITNLIRDTEPHERALFSVPAPQPVAASRSSPRPSDADASKSRRQTVFKVASGEVTTGHVTRAGLSAPAVSNPRRHTAVAAVLGGDMHEQLRPAAINRKTDPVDVEMLLRGAEKLCGVYELPGARERIAALRSRQRNGQSTLAYYEAKVAEQAEKLDAMNKDWMRNDQELQEPIDESDVWTEDDLHKQEEETRALEARKKELQSRLETMRKDLEGLINL